MTRGNHLKLVPLKVLVLAPYLDDQDVGEAYCAYRWVKALAEHADITLLSMDRPEWSEKVAILPGVRCITMQEPTWTGRVPRINAMAKLSYRAFAKWAKGQIEDMLNAGDQFDIAHQFSPFALRHTSPLRHFNIPYVLGPKAGSLKTPEALTADCGKDPIFMQMRGLDDLRFRYSRSLRQSYEKASLVLGAAPYVKETLDDIHLQSFVAESELGVDGLPELSVLDRLKGPGEPVRLLHIGRGVRSKGLRDAIRALSMLPPTTHIHLDVAGKGPEIEHCQILAKELGLNDRVTFHGQIPRADVDTLYKKADIFFFPSFREPSGSVIFEAMSFGLPIIGARVGGPGHVITEKTGILIEPESPEAFAKALKEALLQLIANPLKRTAMGSAARRFIEKEGLWANKAVRMLERYQTILQSTPSTEEISHVSQQAS